MLRSIGGLGVGSVVGGGGAGVVVGGGVVAGGGVVTGGGGVGRDTVAAVDVVASARRPSSWPSSDSDSGTTITAERASTSRNTTRPRCGCSLGIQSNMPDGYPAAPVVPVRRS